MVVMVGVEQRVAVVEGALMTTPPPTALYLFVEGFTARVETEDRCSHKHS